MKIIKSRISGEAKEMIMKRKERLGGKKIYIEKDLTWRGKKKTGKDIQMGEGRKGEG